MERVGGLILAGGASTRMGRPKALLCIEGETFMARLVRLLAAAGCDPIAVVVGADAAVLAPAIELARAGYVLDAEVESL